MKMKFDDWVLLGVCIFMLTFALYIMGSVGDYKHGIEKHLLDTVYKVVE